MAAVRPKKSWDEAEGQVEVSKFRQESRAAARCGGLMVPLISADLLAGFRSSTAPPPLRAMR